MNVTLICNECKSESGVEILRQSPIYSVTIRGEENNIPKEIHADFNIIDLYITAVCAECLKGL